jgi:ribosome-associated protein
MAVPSVEFSSLPAPVRTALEAVDDRKARDVLALDLRGLTEAADYFVVASGTSDAHVRGIADLVLERLAARGVEAHHVEGIAGGRWVLLDFIDFVVHLFHPDARAFYQLERLWGDAPELLYSPTPERKA